MLFLVIADMVMKPTRDDAGVLIAVAAILVAGVAYIGMSVRAIDARTRPAPAAA